MKTTGRMISRALMLILFVASTCDSRASLGRQSKDMSFEVPAIWVTDAFGTGYSSIFDDGQSHPLYAYQSIQKMKAQCWILHYRTKPASSTRVRC